MTWTRSIPLLPLLQLSLFSSPLSFVLGSNQHSAAIWADQVLITEKELFPSVLRNKWSNKSVLIIGDSLSRRLTATIAMYLNVTVDEKVGTVDFGDSLKLSQGGHDYKDWKDFIHPIDKKQIKLCFRWSPRLPPETPAHEAELFQNCSKFSTVAYFSSAFHQPHYKRAYLFSEKDASFRKTYKNQIESYFENLCKRMSKNSQLIMGLSPAGDYSDLRKLRIRARMQPSKTREEIHRLNSKKFINLRKINVLKFYEEFWTCYNEIFQYISSNHECDHISVKLLDHYSLFKYRTNGSMRNKGDTNYHLGNSARIVRMLDLFRNLKK